MALVRKENRKTTDVVKANPLPVELTPALPVAVTERFPELGDWMDSQRQQWKDAVEALDRRTLEAVVGKDGAQGEPGQDGPPGKDGENGLPGKDGATGPPGKDGATGAIGPVGPPGFTNSIYTAEWTWTTKTADAATAGQVGVDAAEWNIVTQVNLNEQRADNTDVTAMLSRIKVGDSFYLQQKTDSTRWARYTVTGAGVDNGTWWSWPVSFVEGAGNLPNGNAPTSVSVLKEGPQIEEWLSGSGAPAGTLGKFGDWYLDTATGDVYEKTGDTTWTLRANIKGPTGATGATGPTGPTGATGAAGPSLTGNARDLVIQNDATTPNSKILVTAEEVILKDAVGAAYLAQAISVTLDMAGTVGTPNALDTGAEAANTWYYIWLIYNGTTVAAVFSASATTPTLPAGYTYKARVGVVRNNATSNFLRMYQAGRLSYIDETLVVSKAFTATYTVFSGADLTAFRAIVPPIAVRCSGRCSGANPSVTFAACTSAGTADNTVEVGACAFIGNSATAIHNPYEVPVRGGANYNIQVKGGTNAISMYVSAFTLP